MDMERGKKILYRVCFNNVCCGVVIRRFFFHYPVEHRYLIVETAPILKKFIHQDIENLVNWIRNIGGTIDECE